MDEAYEFRGGLRWGRAGISIPLARMTVSRHLLTVSPIGYSIPRAPEVHVNKDEVRVVEITKPWYRLTHRVLIHGHGEPAPVIFTTFKREPIEAALEECGWPV